MENNREQHLDKLKAQIEQLSHLGDSQNWEKEDFELLSDLIFKKVEIRIPANALRKVWGHMTTPGKVKVKTLDSLSQYTGADNWKSFKHPVVEDNSRSPMSIFRSMAYPFAVLLGIILLFIVWKHYVG